MNEVRFQELLAAYGADPRRWPESERAAASAYAEQSGASLALREAQALDSLLGDYAGAPAKNDLEIIARLSRNVAAAAPKGAGMASGQMRPTRGRAIWASARNAAAAAGFLAAALTGLFIGFSNGAGGVSTADASDELIAAYAMAEG